jgi:hypothetical protein
MSVVGQIAIQLLGKFSAPECTDIAICWPLAIISAGQFRSRMIPLRLRFSTASFRLSR